MSATRCISCGAAYLAVLLGSACGPDVTRRACMNGSATSSLVTNAAVLRLDVYGADAHCDGDDLAGGAGMTADLSRNFHGGQAITLDVPPGRHVLVITTFADSNATQVLGRGCTEATLTPGAQICFDLTLTPAADGGADAATPPDLAGCGALDTVSNCGACGALCSIGSDNTARACNGTACSYTCAAGYIDCNASVGRDTDGCECAGNGCCSGACQTVHSDGVAESFYDCAALDTYTQTEAMAACAAYTTAHGGTSANCRLSYANGESSSQKSIVCSDNNVPNGSPIQCYCWSFLQTGLVTVGRVEGNCFYPDDTSPAWH
jgi:hypothetical protein